MLRTKSPTRWAARNHPNVQMSQTLYAVQMMAATRSTWARSSRHANQVNEAKTTCSSNLNTCLAKIANAKQCNEDLHCHSCNLDTNDFDNWDFAATCAPTKCTNGKQCVITKTPGVSSATYAVGCSTDVQCNANTQMCCSTDNCNNWLNMTNVNKTLQAFQTAKATCSNPTKLPKDCVDQITEAKKAQTSGVGGLRGGLGLPLITAISVIVLVVLG
ncbi:uncharacterized protein LOC129189026 [Dunckerocampus dactyliophorus]|uniref:uncharacterized protein LOC129189026 n=1 Tax=Dunckerocampus dactyliophorus TaxID=161453 RepID=UPI0024067512|nr:uncharacterized protein LOC129189026 [Dunckerocampus dactyliophorus]